MQIRLLVFSFVVTVAIELGIRKQKENIPQMYIKVKATRRRRYTVTLNTFPLSINFIFNLCIRVYFHSYLIIAKLESLHIENYSLLASGTTLAVEKSRQ